MKIIKKSFFPTFTITSFAFWSSIFALGVSLGYFLTILFCKKFIDNGRIGSIKFNIKDWHLHFHHWLLGGSFLALGTIISLPQFYLGLCGGLILHDLHFDKNWYKVLKKEKIQN